jgi:hypothetical protein
MLSTGELAANVSDGGHDCRTHSNHIRLDTSPVQDWIEAAIQDFARQPR